MQFAIFKLQILYILYIIFVKRILNKPYRDLIMSELSLGEKVITKYKLLKILPGKSGRTQFYCRVIKISDVVSTIILGPAFLLSKLGTPSSMK